MYDLLDVAWKIRQAHFPPLIEFDYPSRTAVVSVTGGWCALNCAHCGRHYLRSMMPLNRAQLDGAKSLLLSGGCDTQGRVPLLEHLDEIRKLLEGQPGLRVNCHTGLIGEAEAQTLAPLVEAFSFDFVGDDETIREVYGLERSVEDYIRTYQMLRRYGRVVPHITLGLRGGRLSGEYRALEILVELGVEGLVAIVFRPTKGTRYEDREPPPVNEVVEFLARARMALPNVPIHLGCLRPQGSYRAALDKGALRAGVNKIVLPSPAAVEMAESLGLEVARGEECCALEKLE